MQDFHFARPRTQFLLTVSSDGTARVHGVRLIPDGTPSGTVLVAENEPATATCADEDGDGVAGLTSLQFNVQDVRTGEVLPVSLTPVDGEVDESGDKELTLVIGNDSRTGTWEVQWVFGHLKVKPR